MTDTKDKSVKEKTYYALDLPGVIDVLNENGRLVYLTSNLETLHSIETDDKAFMPPPKEACPYLLADAGIVKQEIKKHAVINCDEELKLYEDLLSYHKSISDLPHELFYHLLVLWDFHTYLLDKLHFSPILYLYAVRERGKSRTTKGALYVARRGVFTECIREADIIRWGNDHKASLGFDIKDFPKKVERANCDDLFLARFEKGSVSSRTLWPEKGAFRDTKVYQLFGATIIATNRPVDDILESRSIAIDMKPSNKLFSNPVLPENALVLKNRLTAFRVAHYTTPLIKAEKPAHGRFGDIVSPLHQIVLTFFPEKLSTFMELLKVIDTQKKEDAIDSVEAQILEAMLSLKDMVSESFLQTELVANKFNATRDLKFSISHETVGRMLKGLGFLKKRGSHGQRGILYDETLLSKLLAQYGISDGSDGSDSDSRYPETNVNEPKELLSEVSAVTTQDSFFEPNLEKEVNPPSK